MSNCGLRQATAWTATARSETLQQKQDILFEVLRQRGIRIPALPDLGTNKDPPVLIWPRQSRRHDGAP